MKGKLLISPIDLSEFMPTDGADGRLWGLHDREGLSEAKRAFAEFRAAFRADGFLWRAGAFVSAVTVLASGAKLDSGTGSAVDVTGCASLKLAAVMKADHSFKPQLRIMIDTGRSSTGPWREIYAETFRSSFAGGHTWPADSTQRIVLQPDNFVRCRWETKTDVNQVTTNTSSAGLDLAITGVGMPDA
jgi:hypothetical protein